MAAPVPSASTDAAENEEVRLPNNAEDRKAAAALNSLNANELSQENGDSAGSREPSTIDQEALNKAMSRLEVAGGSNKKHASKKEQENRDEVVKKKVKVASEDVNLLVEELDLTKLKATELLKAHDGDAIEAIKAFILPTLKA